jgi:hypothetical protein
MYKGIDIFAAESDGDEHIFESQEHIKADGQFASNASNSLDASMCERALHDLRVLPISRTI